MGILDSIINQAGNTIRSQVGSDARTAVNKAMQGTDKLLSKAVSDFKRKKESFTFDKIPESLDELKALPQANLKNAFGTAALVILAMNNYTSNTAACMEMLTFLKGPGTLYGHETQRMADQLKDKDYHMRSYFEGATPENNYEPSRPYKLTIFDNPHSYDNKGYAVLWVKTAGADTERQIRLRKKESTGEWFLDEEALTPEIRKPKEADPWA